MTTFAIKLRELRKEREVTQKQLAKALTTTNDSIYSWEKGRSQPSIEALCQLCYYFHVSADYLLGLEDETGKKLYLDQNDKF